MIVWYLLICSYLLWISYVDFKTKKITNKSLIILFALGLFHSIFIGSFRSSVKGFLFGGILLLLIYIFTKEGIGEGDIKLIAILGLFLGFEKLVISIFLASVIQLIFRIFLKSSIKDKVPFGPAICFGCILSWFWGYEILFSFL